VSEPVVIVEGLSKQYRIGVKERYGTFRESLMQAAKAPFKRLARIGKAVPENETIWALKDVNFEVKEGEVVGIIGRNGAGKTTLLKILSRITEPTEGVIKMKGRVGSLLEVGTGFHPELTGRENIFLSGAILGMSREEIKKKFDEIVAFAEVGKFLDTPVKRYSSGMYVRLAFGVAAHLEPEILLVDEVLAVGDAAFQKKCLGKMGDVAKEGRTVLFVSHNLESISRLCNRGIWLDQGKINSQGETDRIVQEYLDSNKPARIANINEIAKVRLPWFTVRKIWIEGGNPTESSLVGLFERFSINLSYTSERPLSQAWVAFLISGWNGTKIADLKSCFPDGPWSELPLSGCIECCIERNLFNRGQYSIDVYVVERGKCIFWAHDVAIFEIATNSRTSNPLLPLPKNSLIIIDDVTWKRG